MFRFLGFHMNIMKLRCLRSAVETDIRSKKRREFIPAIEWVL
jgi:hypothetical protein